MSSIIIKGSKKIAGTFIPPGDKSISHRAVMFGSLSEGTSRYSHFLEAEDCLHTMKAFQAMGVPIELERGKGILTVHGVGMNGLKAPSDRLDMGNSGTSMRLMLGILAGQRFESTLFGDASLSSRPMQRVTKPLKQMGAQIKGADNANFAPLTIRGGKLQGIDFENKLLSAQVKSALLFAGMYAEGKTRIFEAISSRDHSERFLQSAGASLHQKEGWLTIEKTQKLLPLTAEIPGDISSAAFFMVGAAISEGSEMTFEKVCLNPTRKGIIDVLKRMGAKMEITVTQEKPEPIGKIRIIGSRLKGASIRAEEIPSLIDEIPILMVAMALAEGESLVSGASELRVKETDRIQSMVTNLNLVGANIQELPDGCLIKGVESFHGAGVRSFGDHRTAMSLAIANLRMKGEVLIQDIDCVNTSFPSFFKDFEQFKQ